MSLVVLLDGPEIVGVKDLTEWEGDETIDLLADSYVEPGPDAKEVLMKKMREQRKEEARNADMFGVAYEDVKRLETSGGLDALRALIGPRWGL